MRHIGHKKKRSKTRLFLTCRLDGMIGDKIDAKPENFRKEITDMVEKMSVNKPSVVPPKRKLESTLDNQTLSTFMKQ